MKIDYSRGRKKSIVSILNNRPLFCSIALLPHSSEFPRRYAIGAMEQPDEIISRRESDHFCDFLHGIVRGLQQHFRSGQLLSVYQCRQRAPGIIPDEVADVRLGIAEPLGKLVQGYGVVMIGDVL